MSSLNLIKKNMQLWISRGWNALFIGRHGVGKSSLVIDAFEKSNLNYQIFSASTLDPWVDFIGIPKERIDEKGNSYIDLIRPEIFEKGDLEAIFLDEYNRSPKMIRNAVMELIQFKSINGKKFPNLKIIWAAINPEEDNSLQYDVETLDPAQKDRFHIQVELPYQPHIPYFSEKFSPEIGEIACNWWNRLSVEEKDLVSPRRLDYALEVFMGKGSIEHVINKRCNPKSLRDALKSTSIIKKIDGIFKKKNKKEAVSFLEDANNYYNGIKYITGDNGIFEFFLCAFSSEQISMMIAENYKGIYELCARQYVHNEFDAPNVNRAIDNILKAETSKVLSSDITRAIEKEKQKSKFASLFKKKLIINEYKEDSWESDKEEESITKNLKKITELHQKSDLSDSFISSAIFDEIKNEVSTSMTVQDAKMCLTIIEKILSSVNAKTPKRWLGFFNVINCLVEVLHTGKYKDWDSFAKLYPSLSTFIFNGKDKFFFKI